MQTPYREPAIALAYIARPDDRAGLCVHAVNRVLRLGNSGRYVTT